LKGYAPIGVGGKTFWTVPFQFSEKPHLVSSIIFKKNQQPPNMLPSPSWAIPVPNAFSAQGESTNEKTNGQTAISYAQTNPNQPFPMQFPYGYIRIILKPNTLKWWLDFPDGIPFQPNETYAFSEGSSTSIELPQPDCGVASAYTDTGFEYLTEDLYAG